MEDMCWRAWNGNWDGRDATRWTGSIKNLRKKIPTFTQEVFCIGTEVNKYKDLIKVICRNSVDGKFALTINLFLHDEKRELLADWERLQSGRIPFKIDPLQ